MLWLAIFISVALIVISLTMIWNVLIFPRLRPISSTQKPFVSILIPARNEGFVIEQTLKKLQQQDYPHFEVRVLNDHSTDSTEAIITSYAEKDDRIILLNGESLPANWSGKSWACQQLGINAKGEILIFTDADVQWEPQALSSLVAMMTSRPIDMLTVWCTQLTNSPTERLTVPLMALVILGYLPVWFVHHTPFAVFAAANGQCMAWTRNAYQRIGGHQPVAKQVLDDVTLARLAKSKSMHIWMADGAGLIKTRMYQDWDSVRNGFAKNILAGYGSLFGLLLGTIFHWLIFLLPILLIIDDHYRLWGILLFLIGILIRALSASATNQRIQDAIWMPISAILMTIIAAQAIYWHFTGGVYWKGRKIDK